MVERLDRRQLLTLLSACSITGLSGCNQQQTQGTVEEGSPTPEPTIETPTETQTETTKSTPGDTTAPEIIKTEVQPENNAQKLRVSLQGADNRIISLARVWYGNRTIEERPNRNQIFIEGRLDKVLQQEPEEYGIVHFLVEDTAGNMAKESVEADDYYPGFDMFMAGPTNRAGELKLEFEAADDNALRTIAVSIGDYTNERDVLGQQSVTGKETVRADHPDLGDAITSGEMHDLSAELQDWAGNTVQRREEVYVREYDVVRETKWDVGFLYIPYSGLNMQRCVTGREPAIGQYGDPIPPEDTDQHIDQMQGHGGGRMLFNYDGSRKTDRELRTLMDASLLPKITVEPFYDINAFEWNKDRSYKAMLEEDGQMIRDHITSKPWSGDHATMWDVMYLVWDEDVKDKIMEEWSGWREFINHFRDAISPRGDELRLVADVHDYAIEGISGDRKNLAVQFDVVTNWVGSSILEGGRTVPWEEAFDHISRNYEALARFAKENNMGFEPFVIPGFDDRGNTCYGTGDRHIERSVNLMDGLFDKATEEATGDRINVPFNPWTEGFQTEPGTHRGNNYGTEFLDVVRKYSVGRNS